MRKSFSGIMGALLLAVAAMSGASASPGRGTVTILHGLPDFTVDVYLDDDLIVDGFRPTTATEPMRLDSGTYDLDVREVGAPATSPPTLSARVKVAPGSSQSVVAHLTRSGDETVSVFDNEFRRIPAGRSLLLVRDVAAAPGLRVLLDGRAIGIRPPAAARGLALAPGRHRIEVRSGSNSDTLIPNTDIRLEEGVAEIVYVIGSARSDSLDLMLQSVRGHRSTPVGVLTGDGGLAAEPGFPAWALALLVAGGCALIGSTRLLRRRIEA